MHIVQMTLNIHKFIRYKGQPALTQVLVGGVKGSFGGNQMHRAARPWDCNRPISIRI